MRRLRRMRRRRAGMTDGGLGAT
ncbi:hypothetical protein [Eikenella glucosivorans]